MSGQFQANAIVVFVYLVCGSAAIGDHATQTHVVIFCLGANGLHNPVHGEDGVEIVGCHDHGAVGVLQGRCKASADHIAEHIKNHHIGVFQQVMLFEQFDGLTHHITTTACAGRRSAGFNAHHTVIAFEYKIFHPQFFGMKIHGFKHINDRGQHFFSQREGAVMLGVTADLQHTFSHFGKCSRQIR